MRQGAVSHCLFRFRQIDNDRFVADSRQKFCQDVLRGNGQRRGVDARVAADAGGFGDWLVEYKLNGVFRVVHQTEHADRAGRDIKVFYLIIFSTLQRSETPKY